MTDLDTGPSSIRDDSICESSLPPNKSSGDIVERCESVAVLIAPLGSASGDGRWVAAQTLREASAEIDRLRLEHDCACREIGAAIAERDEWKAHTTESAAEIERLRRERDEARTIVVEANNSLYGSQGYFHSTNGGPFDKYHLARPIEELKSRARDALTAESAVAAAWEEAARVAKDRWREWRSSYEDDLDGMDACEDISKAISARASAIRAAVSKKTAESGHSPSTHNSASE